MYTPVDCLNGNALTAIIESHPAASINPSARQPTGMPIIGDDVALRLAVEQHLGSLADPWVVPRIAHVLTSRRERPEEVEQTHAGTGARSAAEIGVMSVSGISRANIASASQGWPDLA